MVDFIDRNEKSQQRDKQNTAVKLQKKYSKQSTISHRSKIQSNTRRKESDSFSHISAKSNDIREELHPLQHNKKSTILENDTPPN